MTEIRQARAADALRMAGQLAQLGYPAGAAYGARLITIATTLRQPRRRQP
ncbi:MAG: hypothetical protein JWM19_2518 [Actinomycetia bacterium]|nr:hypothetical protein [Actinomycetes bacterium]